ncbi:hypothetical protein DQ384_36515 [Sphaerisporangium album]|uniref:Uncharacterized protein n=1 Tax=Sphaerisporangium album TaxID=509200 RepID=A0A367ETV8_9ACTN|nr:hypothetical protein [Sphaerisporangium album]RCG21122.1 hypothetical protein DQ384_36515 [Sphaerisporangium album]
MLTDTQILRAAQVVADHQRRHAHVSKLHSNAPLWRRWGKRRQLKSAALAWATARQMLIEILLAGDLDRQEPEQVTRRLAERAADDLVADVLASPMPEGDTVTMVCLF